MAPDSEDLTLADCVANEIGSELHRGVCSLSGRVDGRANRSVDRLNNSWWALSGR